MGRPTACRQRWTREVGEGALMVSESVMVLSTRMLPLHSGHSRTSMPNARRMSSDHGRYLGGEALGWAAVLVGQLDARAGPPHPVSPRPTARPTASHRVPSQLEGRRAART